MSQVEKLTELKRSPIKWIDEYTSNLGLTSAQEQILTHLENYKSQLFISTARQCGKSNFHLELMRKYMMVNVINKTYQIKEWGKVQFMFDKENKSGSLVQKRNYKSDRILYNNIKEILVFLKCNIPINEFMEVERELMDSCI